MISFTELTKQVHIINDLILADMVCSDYDDSDEMTHFSRHLLATKYWFSRISWANKRRYLLALLEDVRSAWALSLLLKSMWNCRPKDAVLSVNEEQIWSTYDQVPMDHNRTATPLTVLAQVMKNDRMWFLTQEPEPQALILSELLTIAGGPVMWVVLRRAQFLYERYRDIQLQNLQECVVVNDPPPEKGQVPEKGKKEPPAPKQSLPVTSEHMKQPGRAQKELEANLAVWNATIKAMRDSLKLEELEMTFNDGTKRKIWKVNRQKPENIETVDFLQLLPSSIGKLILSYLPRAQLLEYSKVNKYWSYLVDEFRAELTARQKIDLDYDKLHEIMLRHDVSLELVEQMFMPPAPPSSQGNVSAPVSIKNRPLPSMKASEKSGGAYSLKRFLSEKLRTPATTLAQRPIRNMAELTERLEQRGAADENLWKWCDNVLKRVKIHEDGQTQIKEGAEGILPLGNAHFPCPMMKKSLEVPLHPPLISDPAMTARVKTRRNISSMMVIQSPKEFGVKRYSLWTRDFSSLYPVLKIPSYQSPF